MSDGSKPNLEPIEDADLDLAHKFKTVERPLEAGKEAAIPENIEAKEILPEKLENREVDENKAERDSTYAKILAKVKTNTAPVQNDISGDAKTVSEGANVEAKIGWLIDLAMEKGVVHAVKVAQHMDDNYMLDEFHDRLLIDEFHDALVEKGLIKDV
jgi:hypothetical protein